MLFSKNCLQIWDTLSTLNSKGRKQNSIFNALNMNIGVGDRSGIDTC